MRDRRAAFFLVAALLCFAMVPVAEQKFRTVATVTGVVYVLFALASLLDARSRGH